MLTLLTRTVSVLTSDTVLCSRHNRLFMCSRHQSTLCSIVPWQLRELDAQFLCSRHQHSFCVHVIDRLFMCSRHQSTLCSIVLWQLRELDNPPSPLHHHHLNFETAHMTMMGTRPLACRKDRCGFPPKTPLPTPNKIITAQKSQTPRRCRLVSRDFPRRADACASAHLRRFSGIGGLGCV